MIRLHRRLMTAVLSLAAIAGLALTAFILLTDDSEPSLEEVSVEQLYQHVDTSLLEQESVYHVFIDFQSDARDYRLEGTVERWVDARQAVAREERRFVVHLSSGEQRPVEGRVIYTENGTYNDDEGQVSEGPPPDCGGASVAISVVLGCTGFLTEVTNRTEIGSFEGNRAIVFVREGLSVGSDETTASTQRLYLDPRTFLPFGAEGVGTSPTQGEATSRNNFEVDWIPRDSLSPDFFDPAAVGFDREAAIRNATDLQVYWLGRRFEAPGVEPLVLKATHAAPGRGRPYRYHLTYVRESDPHNPPFLTLMVFFRDVWEASPPVATNAVFIGETVVSFSEAKTQEGPNTILTPEGLEALKAGLRAYE